MQYPRFMGNPTSPVHKYMTSSPHSIGVDQPLVQAHSLMREHDIRHLPVLSGGTLVGLLTERDLHLIETLKDVDPAHVTVEEAMTAPVYCVAPEAPLDEVVTTMAERKFGAAVVMRHGKVAGILTTVDVCKALADLLRTRSGPA